jgi:hypothetical protein
MNKEQIINEAYVNYSKEYEKDNSIGLCLLVARMDGRATYRKPDKEMFVDLCTYDKTFSEKWGLKIEERELSEEERWRIRFDYYPKDKQFPWDRMALPSHRFLDDFNIPRRVITITYNDKTITSYEK